MGQGSGWDAGPNAASQAPECRKLISWWLRGHGEAWCWRQGIRRAYVLHRGIPVLLQNACVNGGRKISCNMAFCDRREIAKGRKIQKGSVFLSLPFPTTLESLRKYPAIRNNVKKPGTIFPGEPGRIPSRDCKTQQKQGCLVPLMGKQGMGFLLSFSSSPFVEPCCHVPSTRRRDVAPCLSTLGACTGARAGMELPMSSPYLPKRKAVACRRTHAMSLHQPLELPISPLKCLLIEH